LINEEIDEKTLTVAVQVAQTTYEELKKVIGKLIEKLKSDKDKPQKIEKEPELKCGKQTLKQLQKHNDGLSSIELTDPNLRLLHRSMKKDGVDFAAVKDGKGKYTLFFKGKDADTLTHAFSRYTKNLIKHANRGKPSINAALASAKQAAQTLNAGRNREQNRNRGALDR